MVSYSAVVWLCVALYPHAPHSMYREPLQAPAPVVAPQTPIVNELNLDRFLSVYEDLGAALANVENVTDADMVASRVAVDFLLLRGMDQAMSDNKPSSETHVSPEFFRSFKLRREQARTAVVNAMRRIREANCYGSEALPAALSLSVYIGVSPTGTKPESEIAAQVLLANNWEMVELLLGKVVDKESADLVASLIESASHCHAALGAYAQELGTSNMDASQVEFYEQRCKEAQAKIILRKDGLEKTGYYDSKALRECLEALPLP